MNKNNFMRFHHYTPSVLYPVFVAISSILTHQVNQSVNPIFALLICVCLAIVIFSIPNLKHTRFVFDGIRHNKWLFIKVNFLISAVWIFTFLGLYLLPPDIYILITFTLMASLAFFNLFRSKGHWPELVAAAGLVLIVFVLSTIYLIHTAFAEKSLLGILVGVLSGVSYYQYQKHSFALSQVFGGVPSIVLVVRSFGIILISLGIVIILLCLHRPLNSQSWSISTWGLLFIVSLTTFILPIYLNQVGLEKLGPQKHSIFMALTPIITVLLTAATLSIALSPLFMSLLYLSIMAFVFLTFPLLTKLYYRHRAGTILVVDQFTSAKYLASRFHQLGYAIVRLSYAKLADEYFQFDPALFDLTLSSKGTLKQDVEYIKHTLKERRLKPIIAVISGFEASADYADSLAVEFMGKKANNPKSSAWRMNKFAMNQRLLALKVSSIQQKYISQDETHNSIIKQAIAFFNTLSTPEMIIKPNNNSAGTVGVASVRHNEDIHAYFNNIKHSPFGKSDFLLQEKLNGTEYYVDMSAYNGKHIISGIGRYRKNGFLEYQYHDDLNLDDTSIQHIKQYTGQLSQALDLRNGLFHIEIMDTPNGPRLIEVNPRISGPHGYCNIMAKMAHGVDQVDAYVALLRHQEPLFTHFQSFNRLYVLKNHIGNFEHLSVNPIQKLSTFSSLHVLKTSETNFNANNHSLLNTVAFIHLSAKTQEAINHDTEQLEKWEKSGRLFISDTTNDTSKA